MQAARFAGYIHPVPGEPEEIRTARLILRRPVDADLPAVVALHTDPRTNVHRPEGPRTAPEATAVFAQWQRTWRETGLSYWMIEHQGTVIGFGGLREVVDDGTRVLNIYYRFRPESWGQGFATEMARAAVDYAERAIPDIPLLILTTPDNTPSLRVAARLGFTERRRRTVHGVEEVLLGKDSQL